MAWLDWHVTCQPVVHFIMQKECVPWPLCLFQKLLQSTANWSSLSMEPWVQEAKTLHRIVTEDPWSVRRGKSWWRIQSRGTGWKAVPSAFSEERVAWVSCVWRQHIVPSEFCPYCATGLLLHQIASAELHCLGMSPAEGKSLLQEPWLLGQDLSSSKISISDDCTFCLLTRINCDGKCGILPMSLFKISLWYT